MKTVTSAERETGRGAKRYTAVLMGSEWVRVSYLSNARFTGRDRGVEHYEVDVADDAVTAEFYRSNSGNESVDASNGMRWESFAEADRWAAGESSPATCPHCGREM